MKSFVSRIRELFDCDFDTGKLYWKKRDDVPAKWNTRYAGKEAGAKTHKGYVQVLIDGKFVFAHHVVYAMKTGIVPCRIDHRNGDGFDNRFCNLREASASENARNRKAVEGSIPFRGVYFHKERGKFAAQIKVDKNWFWLGLHETAELAAEAYDKKAVELHGEFASTNKKMGLL